MVLNEVSEVVYCSARLENTQVQNVQRWKIKQLSQVDVEKAIAQGWFIQLADSQEAPKGWLVGWLVVG